MSGFSKPCPQCNAEEARFYITYGLMEFRCGTLRSLSGNLQITRRCKMRRLFNQLFRSSI